LRTASPRAPVEPRSCPEPQACTPPLADSSRLPVSRLPGAMLACGLAAGALVAGVIDGAMTGWRDADPTLPIPVSGSRTLPIPLRVLIVEDESQSTSSTDPTRESHRAALLVCDWLATNSQNPADRVGLVRFADQADSVDPVPAGHARQVLERALDRGDGLGVGTRLTPAIAELQRLLAHRQAERDVVLLVTDGQVAEPHDELRALIGQLRAEADAVYLLALDDDGSWSKHTHQRYDDLGLSGTIPISKVTAGRLAYAIATLLMHEAGIEPAGRR
jgi:hypothetical protein